MIIHRHSDGSEGYQYELGDRVIVDRTIHGGWFDYGPTHAEHCKIVKIDTRAHWCIAKLEIWYSKEWGPASCFPWMIRPHRETMLAARVVNADTEEPLSSNVS